MPQSTDTLIAFLQLLETTPPILTGNEKESLSELAAILAEIPDGEYALAAEAVINWGENHEAILEAFTVALEMQTRKELDNLPSKPEGESRRIPNFYLDADTLVSPEPSPDEKSPPQKHPLASFLRTILQQVIDKL